jgi:hypothetical protein
MALAGRWSPLGGLIALSGITVLGFVPVRALGARAGVFLFGRPLLADGFEEQWAAASRAADEEWSDWYAEVRRQVDEERLRQEAEAEAAEREWRDWYADVRRREEDRRRHEAEREAAEQEWPHWNAESHPDAVGSEPDRPRTDFAAGLP